MLYLNNLVYSINIFAFWQEVDKPSKLSSLVSARHKKSPNGIKTMVVPDITEDEDDIVPVKTPVKTTTSAASNNPQFTPEMKAELDSVLSKKSDYVVVTAFNLRITRGDLECLEEHNWINEEVINMYMNLLIERGKKKTYPTVYAFNTFFFTKLMSTGQIGLRRWTKGVDIFSCDLVVIPVHLDVHWCVAVVDFRVKQIKYFDSIGAPNDDALQAILSYLKDEHMDKKKIAFDTAGWELSNVLDGPQQENTSDCGVFSCVTAEYICRDAELTFSQDDMPYFRRKMIYEIMKVELLT